MSSPEETGFPRRGSSLGGGKEAPGLANRIERLAQQRPPAPKGRGIVLVLIGLAMVWAMIETFTRGSSAGRAVEKSHKNERPPVSAPPDPQALPAPVDVPQGPDLSQGLPGPVDVPQDPEAAPPVQTSFDVALPDGLPPALARDLRLNLGSLGDLQTSFPQGVDQALREIAPLVGRTPEAQRAAVRAMVFQALARAAKRPRFRRGAYEAASWLLPDAGEESEETVLDLLILAGRGALQDDTAAPAVIAFLDAYPHSPGPAAVAALDATVLDAARPLHIRVAAARARPTDKRSAKVDALASDPDTHPLLRAAISAPASGNGPSDG
jgi:hypothetical protein